MSYERMQTAAVCFAALVLSGLGAAGCSGDGPKANSGGTPLDAGWPGPESVDTRQGGHLCGKESAGCRRKT
jgi:hypothetical protein